MQQLQAFRAHHPPSRTTVLIDSWRSRLRGGSAVVAAAAVVAPRIERPRDRCGNVVAAASLAPRVVAATTAAAATGKQISPPSPDEVLQRLALYVPRSRTEGSVFGDGPFSVNRVLRPYRREQVVAVLSTLSGGAVGGGSSSSSSAARTLDSFSLRQLAGIAAALAALGVDGRGGDDDRGGGEAGAATSPFLAALAAAAARKLREAAAAGGGEWGPTCHLALAYARMGVADAELMGAIAAAATVMLESGAVRFKTRRRSSQLAALVGAFAALRVRSPRLVDAVAEVLKQQASPSALGLMGPWESIVLVWAVGRLSRGGGGGVGVGGGGGDSGGGDLLATRTLDATLWTLLQEHAATRAGQLRRHDLCRAYCMVAAAAVSAAPGDTPPSDTLMRALRRALRERLNVLKPRQLVAALSGLAGLQHRDDLLMDEIALWVRNKAATFTPGELAAAMAAMAALRYRNPWLLRHLSRVMASGKLRRLSSMTGAELATVAASAARLEWRCDWLMAAIGEEAASRRSVVGVGGNGGGGGGGVAGVLSSSSTATIIADELAVIEECQEMLSQLVLEEQKTTTTPSV